MGPCNELGLYAFFKEILSQSMVMEGRYVVLKGVGEDINDANFGQRVTDVLSGFTTQKKYPCTLMLPPNETGAANDRGWSNFKLQMFFLCLNQRTGDGAIKQPDIETNTSTHTYQQDWKDMREVAGNFVAIFRQLTRTGAYPIRENDKVPEVYRRVTKVGNDAANGISLHWEVKIWNGDCELVDYPDEVAITMTDFNPHPLHKQ